MSGIGSIKRLIFLRSPMSDVERWKDWRREALLSTLVSATRAATQRSVKFIRWLRQSLRDRLAEADAAPRLSELYATW